MKKKNPFTGGGAIYLSSIENRQFRIETDLLQYFLECLFYIINVSNMHVFSCFRIIIISKLDFEIGNDLWQVRQGWFSFFLFKS